MATFSQWFRARPVRRLTWVCGPEFAFVQEVIQAHIDAAPGSWSYLTAGEGAAEGLIWDEILQEHEVPWTWIIRNAQKLTRWEYLDPAAISSTVVFVSAEEKFAEEPGEDGRLVLASHLRVFRDKNAGQLIRCVAPDDEPEWLAEWAGAKLGAGKVLGQYLLARCFGRVSDAAIVADKIKAAHLAPDRAVIQTLTEGLAVSSFTDAILRGRCLEALTAADLDHGEIGAAIGRLASALETLSVLHVAAGKKLNARETAMKLGVRQTLQHRYGAMAPRYTPARVRACRTVLAVADDAWRSGITEGIPEFVAMLWGV
jgi:hypothetical protein